MLDGDRVDDKSLRKGIIAGAIAGMAGVYAMNLARRGWAVVEQNVAALDEEAGSQQDPATLRAAEEISIAVRNRGLTESEKEAAAETVPYGIGLASGAAYGVIAEMAPVVGAGMGIPFGVVLFGVVDEVAVPGVGLSDRPVEIPAEVHARGLVAHVAFGLATELTRRVVRSVLD